MTATVTTNWTELIELLPADSQLVLHNKDWDEYEGLLEQVGEASGLRISYDDGVLIIMTLSSEHENYVRFFEKLITAISLRLRVNIRSFGSMTLRRRQQNKGNEPDACFYVQNATLIGNKLELDLASDPPPDIAVEIDVHHGSESKFSIYVALGVPEIWRFDGQSLTIHLLQQDHSVEAETSLALPLLCSQRLTDFLTRMRNEGEFQSLIAFDEWLQAEQHS